MVLGMSTGLHDKISCAELGLSGATCADGLAVGRASGFVGKFMEPHLFGCYTLSDQRMYWLLMLLADSEGIFLETSALAGMLGPVLSQTAPEFAPAANAATHIVWATGGSMVPRDEMDRYYAQGAL
jgi:D-serine dehydratase